MTLADADPTTGVLRICESKFHKSRFVPLSFDASRELHAYLQQRLIPPLSAAPDSPLLCNCTRGLRAYTGTGLSRGLQLLIRSANVQSTDGRRPRVHDFRHSFAVQALLRWYRQGADVQSRLPKRAMYMGHVSIVSTVYYLKWLPDIATAASDRRFLASAPTTWWIVSPYSSLSFSSQKALVRVVMAANFSAMAVGILWDMNVAIRGNVRAAFWQIRPPITKLLERLSRL